MSSKLKRLAQLMAHLGRQGCRVRTTPDGWFVQFPDGSATSFHKSNSDVRAMKNARSAVRRAGLEWPSWANHL